MDTARIYLGTYTGEKSQGIYLTDLDLRTGTLSTPRLAGKSTHPTYLALHGTGRHLLAANEQYEQNNGFVSAFRVDPATGALTPINQVHSMGGGPCYVSTDKTGKWVLVANYGGGTAAVIPVGPDGTLRDAVAVIDHRTGGRKAHAHCILTSPDNRFALVADLGINQVRIYPFDANSGKVDEAGAFAIDFPAGAGPRHVRFHPNGRLLYVVNELNSTVAVFNYDATNGRANEVQTVPMLPADYTGKRWAAELVIHPNGKWLYASNRAHETIASYALDEPSGQLTQTGHVPVQGKTPRNFGIDPTGQFLVVVNQDSHNAVVFRVNQTSGALTPTGSTVEVGSPVCVRFFT
jgi:6-phosphogluconolactonase